MSGAPAGPGAELPSAPDLPDAAAGDGPRLPPRLRAVLAVLPAGTVADVGAGHGALAAHLALAGRRVVATESAPGPLGELHRNLARWGLAARVAVRMGSGLAPLAAGEVDGAVAAGLGADRLAAIAAQAPAAGLRWLALQCVQRPWRLNAWIDSAVVRDGWRVLATLEPAERGRPYPSWVLAVGRG